MIANTTTDILNSEIGMMMLLSIAITPFVMIISLIGAGIRKIKERSKR